MKFRMKDFRRFHDQADVDIKPITILIGENSSGKSSFLAGLRLILEEISEKGEGSFNREPFFLGAYDQIAHYRGGRFGRAKEFELGVSFEGDEMKNLQKEDMMSYNVFIGEPSQIGSSNINISFDNEKSQPTISKLLVENTSSKLVFERAIAPNFTYQDLSTNSPLIIKTSENSELRKFRSINYSRNNIHSFFQLATDWAFENYRVSTRSKKRDSEEFRIAKSILGSWYGVFAISSDAVYSAAPFRTKPERIYSPVEATSGPEGAHVPILLAQAKSFEKAKWNYIKEKLEIFGEKSGMFRKVDIKRLGKLDSDPFQLIITVSKDKSNIVDVGYGVSQLLPLVVETIINIEAKFFFFQQPEVHLHPRGQAELGSYFVDFVVENKKIVVIETHSDYMIDRIRNDLVRKKLDPSEYLSILYFDKEEFETKILSIEVGDNGAIINPPEKYRNFFLEESLRNMGF